MRGMLNIVRAMIIAAPQKSAARTKTMLASEPKLGGRFSITANSNFAHNGTIL
jgi:hypothetical protein